MEINPNSRIAWSPSLPQVQATRTAPELERDRASFDEIENLKQALEGTPDVRQAVVARARSLLGDVNYPPMETIHKIGELLAVHFSESAEASPSTGS